MSISADRSTRWEWRPPTRTTNTTDQCIYFLTGTPGNSPQRNTPDSNAHRRNLVPRFRVVGIVTASSFEFFRRFHRQWRFIENSPTDLHRPQHIETFFLVFNYLFDHVFSIVLESRKQPERTFRLGKYVDSYRVAQMFVTLRKM